MNKLIGFAIVAVIIGVAGFANAGELTRVYHNGKPNGSPPSTIFSSAMGAVAANGNDNNGRVWVSSNDAYSDQYSNWNIINNSTNINDFLRSSRTGMRGLTGTTSSAISTRYYYNRY